MVSMLRSTSRRALGWHVDAAFAVHPDYRSHKGDIMFMGEGVIISISRKQGMYTRSATEAELVAADEVALWCFGE
jgi:aspartyl aminopeptidase